MTPEAQEIVRRLGLAPHAEGGHYREIHRDVPADGGRGAVTSIYFLLAADERSHWHRVDATEIWHFHAGAALRLEIAMAEGGDRVRHRLGPDLAAGEVPQAIVPPNAWQSAQSLGEWTLVGCTVAPAFDFAGFELAPPDFEP